VDYKRINGASADNINIFFDRLDNPQIKDIPPRFWFNPDEVGVMEGIGSNSTVIGESSRSKIISKEHQDRTWATVIECISATGQCLNPLFIFAGKNAQQQWFPHEETHDYDSWHFTTSDSGWTNDEIALSWLRTIFLPETKPQDPEQWRVLVLDGHGSHRTEMFMQECFFNKVWVVYLPAHSSHVLQPLDVGVYSPLKRYLRLRLQIQCMLSCTDSPGKPELLRAYTQARKHRLTKANAQAGWKATGIFPRDRQKPLSSRFVLKGQGHRAPPTSPTSIPPSTPDFDLQLALTVISTPKSSKDLYGLQKNLSDIDPVYGQPTARLLFRKFGKILDETLAELAHTKYKAEILQTVLDKTKSQKRRRVLPDPNKDFVTMQAVWEERRRMGG